MRFPTKVNAAWWATLMDGKPHDVDIRTTSLRTMTLLRATIYRQAEAHNNRAIRTKRLDPWTIRVQAWSTATAPGRGQVDPDPQPLPAWEDEPPAPERGSQLDQKTSELVDALMEFSRGLEQRAKVAGLPAPSVQETWNLFKESRSTSGQ